VETKRVRDRLRRKHPRSEELLGNVQRWSASTGELAPGSGATSGLRALDVDTEIGDARGKTEKRRV
jgi:hypothetical protein